MKYIIGFLLLTSCGKTEFSSSPYCANGYADIHEKCIHTCDNQYARRVGDLVFTFPTELDCNMGIK